MHSHKIAPVTLCRKVITNPLTHQSTSAGPSQFPTLACRAIKTAQILLTLSHLIATTNCRAIILARPFHDVKQPGRQIANSKTRVHTNLWHPEPVLATKLPMLTISPNLITSPTNKLFAISMTLTGGGERARTDDLRLAKPALSQLSYTPVQTKANKSYQIKTAFY